MTEENEGPRKLLSPYGELVVLLDADPAILREAFKDCNREQLLDIISIYEDQLNDTFIEGNEKLFKRHLYCWMFCIRQLDPDKEERTGERADEFFHLNFSSWEAEQHH